MYERSYQWWIAGLIMISYILWCLIVVALLLSSGCVSTAKNIGKEVMATPTPTPSPTPTPLPPTPRPTPASIKTLVPHPVDPFAPGLRWEGQWFQWNRKTVNGFKDMDGRVIVYRHAFLDYYTWYDNLEANYQVKKPAQGNRYFVIWIHEELAGNISEFDSSMWASSENDFYLQVKNQILPYNPEVHDPVNRIKEFSRVYDYYKIDTAGPFGWLIRYSGSSRLTGGFVAEAIESLRMGEGNAIDGYLIFEVPESTREEDIQLIGNFAQPGSAWWRFDSE